MKVRTKTLPSKPQPHLYLSLRRLLVSGYLQKEQDFYGSFVEGDRTMKEFCNQVLTLNFMSFQVFNIKVNWIFHLCIKEVCMCRWAYVQVCWYIHVVNMFEVSSLKHLSKRSVCCLYRLIKYLLQVEITKAWIWICQKSEGGKNIY